MLVNCPECQSPVFVRAAAIEQRKPQRCYACKAQLLVDSDGQVDVAVSGKREAARGIEDDGPTLVRPPASPARAGAAATRATAPASNAAAPNAPAFDPFATRIVPEGAPQRPPSPGFDPDATRIVAEAPKAPPPSAEADPDATRIVAETPKAAPPSAAADPTRPLSRDPRAYASSTGPRPVTMVGVNLEEMMPRKPAGEAAADDDKTLAGSPWPPAPHESRPARSTPPPAALPDLPVASAEDVLLVAEDEEHTAIAPDPRRPVPAAARAPTAPATPAPAPPALTPPPTPPAATAASAPRGTAIPRELSVEVDLAFADVTDPAALSVLPWEPGYDPAPPAKPPAPPPSPWSAPSPASPAYPATPPSRATDPWFNEGTLVQDIPDELLQATVRTGEHQKPSLAPAIPPATTSQLTGAVMPDAPAPSGLPSGADVGSASAYGGLEGPPAPRFSDRPVEELFDRTGVLLSPPSIDDIPVADVVELPLSDQEPPVVAGSLLDAPEELFFQAPLPSEPAPAAPPPAAALTAVAPDSPSFAASSYDDEPYAINAPARRRGGALSWVAALVVGVAAGGAGAYYFPAAPPLAPAEQTLANAAELIRTGRVKEASTLLEEVLVEQPDHPLAVRTSAISAALLGDTDAAERHYLRYLALTKDEADARAVRALLGLDDNKR